MASTPRPKIIKEDCTVCSNKRYIYGRSLKDPDSRPITDLPERYRKASFCSLPCPACNRKK